MNKPTESSRQVQRIADVIRLLKGKSLIGLSLRDMAKALSVNDPTLLRTLNLMKAADMVTQIPETGRWVLSIVLLQVAESHHLEMSKASTRLNELQQRVQAGAHN